MAKTVKFSMSLPDDLAQRMDVARGPLGRSSWIQSLIAAHFEERDGGTAKREAQRGSVQSSLSARAHVKPIPKRGK